MSKQTKQTRQTSGTEIGVSIECEQKVLGAVLIGGGDVWITLAPIIGEQDFSLTRHRVIWQAMSRRIKAGEPVDLVSIGEALRDAGQIRAAGGHPYLGELVIGAVPATAEHHAKRLAELSRRRQVVEIAEAMLAEAGSAPADEILGRCLERISGAASVGSESAAHFADVAQAAVIDLDEIRRRRRAGVIGVSTTLPSLDHVLGGIYGPNLIVVAARPGMGKTALAGQIALKAAMQGHPGLFVSIEMSKVQLAQRAAAMISGCDLSRIMRGAPEATAAIDRLVDLGDLPLWIDDLTSDLDSICARIMMYRQRYAIEFAVVDHIGLIRTERFNTRNEQIGHISWTLKRLAKRLGIPIIALSQLSRRSEQESRRPRADDLRDSGNIEQDADVILMLHADPADRAAAVRSIQIGIVKNRLGPCAWLAERFEFIAGTQTFREIAPESMDGSY